MARLGNFVRNWLVPDKALVVFGLILLAAIWSAALWQIARDRQDTLATVRNGGDKVSRAFEEQVRAVLRMNEHYLLLMANEFRKEGSVTPTITGLLKYLGSEAPAVRAGIAGADGYMIASTMPAPPSINFSAMPYFAVHKAADIGRMFVSQPLAEWVAKTPMLHLSRRLNGAHGEFAGVAIVALDADYFSQFYMQMDFSSDYTVRLIGLDGVIRASNSLEEAGCDFSGARIFREVARQPAGFYYAPGTQFGKRGYMSYRVMTDYPLIVQVGLAESALAPLAQRRGMYLAAAGGMSVFIIWFTARLLVRSRRQRLADLELQGSYEQLTAINEELTASHEQLTANEEELRKLYTEVVATNKMLEHSRRTAEELFQAAGDGFVVFDGESGDILDVNRRLTEMFGYTQEEFKEQGLVLLASPANLEMAFAIVRRAVTDGPQPLVEIETLDRHGNRLIAEISAGPVTIDGKPRCLALLRDVTVRRQLEDGLEFLRLRDPLTGVYNRAFFESDMLRVQVTEAGDLGMFVCDVDGLKLINDTLGHLQGDELLRNVAALLEAGVQKPGYVARIGGDEFAVILLSPTKQTMEELDQYYRRAVEAYNKEVPHLPLSLSIGWAMGACSSATEVVFKEADNNMYRQKLHQSQSVRGSIVQTMMKALEERDHITEGHADRLGERMGKMGRTLKLPQGTIADLRLLAKFHDIGKVGIPDSILNKPGRLSEEELAVMRRHCEIGYRIAKASPDLEPIADWILKHQEWWNGQGYPLGIAAESIPLECRILGIVDAYDAMTNDRPYRKAMSSAKALAELRRCAGTQFDPSLVELFATLVEAGG